MLDGIRRDLKEIDEAKAKIEGSDSSTTKAAPKTPSQQPQPQTMYIPTGQTTVNAMDINKAELEQHFQTNLHMAEVSTLLGISLSPEQLVLLQNHITQTTSTCTMGYLNSRSRNEVATVAIQPVTENSPPPTEGAATGAPSARGALGGAWDSLAEFRGAGLPQAPST